MAVWVEQGAVNDELRLLMTTADDVRSDTVTIEATGRVLDPPVLLVDPTSSELVLAWSEQSASDEARVMLQKLRCRPPR